MFSLMKDPEKDDSATDKSVSLYELYTGSIVGFGFMPQKNISGQRIAVEEINSYIFHEDSFLAYRFENDSADINLIIADEDNPVGTYLALSQRIAPRMFETLFPDHEPQYWFALKEDEKLTVDSQALGTLNGWLTAEYTLVVSTVGRLLKGDYRLRKPADRTRLSQPFNYVLLVDEENEYALEAEKYEDGTLQVFATVYRPATDIGEISRTPKFASAPSIIKTEAESMPLSLTVEKIAHERPMPLLSTNANENNIASETALKTKQVELEILTPQNAKPVADTALAVPKEEVAANEIPPVPPKSVFPESSMEMASQAIADKQVVEKDVSHQPVQLNKSTLTEIALLLAAPEETPEKTILTQPIASLPQEKNQAGVIVPPEIQAPAASTPEATVLPVMPVISSHDMLSCDLQLAGRLINEAQRNQIALSDLIRKVIDLPARIKEKVFIPFMLESAEAEELARRYKLPNSDLESVKSRIIEELKRFVGDKK